MMDRKKIAVIGGGHGTSVVLKALSNSNGALTGILSMADDGGSTGRLRNDLGVPALGDIRQCLASLSSRPDIAALFSYRLEKGSLKGHSLGNLILAAEELQEGDLEKSIDKTRMLLGVAPRILPSTAEDCRLILNLGEEKATGVYKIANVDFNGMKPDLSLEPPAKLASAAATAIEEADYIIIAPGNFYCSIMPALLVDGLAKAINSSKAKVIFIANLVNRLGHTQGFRATDYVDEARRLTGGLRLDALIYNTANIAADCLREGEEMVGRAKEDTGYLIVGADISDAEKVASTGSDEIAAIRSLVRHDTHKLARTLAETMEKL